MTACIHGSKAQCRFLLTSHSITRGMRLARGTCASLTSKARAIQKRKMLRVRPNPPSWVVFFSAHRRLRRPFISCSLHPLALQSAKAKYCWVLTLAGSLNEGKCCEHTSRKPISSLILDTVNLTGRYCSYTYSVKQTQGRWRLLASNLRLLF